MCPLYYFYDPMCSWCYAFDKNLKKLESALPKSITVKKVLAGLAADSSEPMPESLRLAIQSNWHKIEDTVLGIEFNYDFWKNNVPLRSTYSSCRAVIAAKKQSLDFADKMTRQIQLAYYQQAKNPSLDATLLNCARQIKLDYRQFETDFRSDETEVELKQQIQFTQSLGVSSFPSLRLKINNNVLAIKIDYNDEKKILKQILNYTGDDGGVFNSE